MKGLNLTHKHLVHNSGEDLWDYMFENQPLKYLGLEDEADENAEWYQDSIDWMTEQLLDGEVFATFTQDERYAYTSLGRHINLKKKRFNALMLQGWTIAGNMQQGAFSMTKLVKSKWDIDLDYRTLPEEVRKPIVTSNASKFIKQWIKDNHGA